MRSRGFLLIVAAPIATIFMLLILSLMLTTPSSVEAGDKESSSKFGVSQLNKLGGKIDGLEPPSGIVFFGNVITCAASITCIGTNNDDIIYAGAREQVFALNGDDIVYGGLGDQVYGGRNNDLLVGGPGRILLDGGPHDDVLLGGAGNGLLIGGKGNDKLFNGADSTVMYGGPGANHFDCSLSALGLAKSAVMDYNPSNGDTISGPCKLVNTIGDGDTDVPQITLPNTDGDTESGISPSGGAIPGL